MTENKQMTFFEFCEKLKEDGAYIGDDWHIYNKNNKPLSRQMRNGYYTVRKMYNNHEYCFCEHRVIWYFWYGEFDTTLTINHKDFDRTNNNIENLELVTMADNIKYTHEAGRGNAPKAEKQGKAIFTNDEVKAIRYLKQHGYSTKQIQQMFDVKWSNTINRVANGSRYGSVADAADVLAIYPIIVNRTWQTDIPKEERIKNAIFGLNGEIGELTDLFKKAFYHGHELDEIHVMLELGDILYYACALCNELELDFSEICYQNMVKLQARYPDGFSAEKSLHRAEGDI